MRSASAIDFANKFRGLMQEAGLDNRQAADLCCVSEHTVIAWMKRKEVSSHNRCPEWAVELLRLKIDERNRT